MKALFMTFNRVDMVFYVKHQKKVKSDLTGVQSIMGALGYNAPLEFWRDNTTLVEVSDPKVLGGKVWRFFTGVNEEYGGSFTPYEDCKEFFI